METSERAGCVGFLVVLVPVCLLIFISWIQNAQAKLQQGKRVHVHVTGYRWYFMSWFPNIVRVDVIGG